MKAVRLLLLPLLALSLVAAAKKPTISVRFHLEANPRDGEAFATKIAFHSSGREGYIERVPSISERDIKAILPTPASDGTFGCVFALDRHGANSLQTFSMLRRGSMLVTFISTKSGTHQVAEMLIDKAITDGVIFVPRGLTQLEVAALQKQFPTIGETKKRK